MNWRTPVKDGYNIIVIIHYNKKEPRKSIIETNAPNILVPFHLRALSLFLKSQKPVKQNPTRGNDYLIAAYCYAKTGDVEERSDVGCQDTVLKFVDNILEFVRNEQIQILPLRYT